ncbi:MAG: winged helix-turn-helix domain-containing protein [Vicinamibacteraceae bacterium]
MSSFADLRRHADATGTVARPALTAAVLRVGGTEIDMRRHEIRRDGETIRLQQQPFQILALLIEHAGHVVTRQQIERRLWPDGTSVDFEHSVNAAIRRLRVALADDAIEPRFVETVPRRGYRFVGRVDAASRLDERRPAASVRPRVLVKPFLTRGEAPADELGAELIEELVAQLAHRGADRVDVLTRAPEAGAGPARPCYRIEGSVRVAGGSVRVLATLIDGRDETHRWACGYDRQVDGTPSAPADVAAAIADAVVARLLPVASVPAPSARPATPQADGAASTAWSRREWATGIVTSGTRWSSSLTR